MRRAVAVLAGLAAWLPASADGHGRGCNTRACDVRVAHDQAKRRKLAVVAPYRSWLLRVAECESGRRWWIATGNGFYGGLQFTLSSWRSVGGRGYPHKASRLEQMYRGARLLKSQGPRAWPVCQAQA